MHYQKIKFITLIFIFSLCKMLMAQQTDSLAFPKGVIFKIPPLQLYDGELRLLLEKHTNMRNSIEFTASYYANYSFYEMYQWEKLFDKRIGFKAGVGFRHYFGKEHFYINPSFFYKYMDYTTTSWDVAEGFGAISYHFYRGEQKLWYDFNKQVISFQLELGRLVYESKHLIVDVYGGAGGRLKYIIREKNITNSQIVEYLGRPNILAGLLIAYKK